MHTVIEICQWHGDDNTVEIVSPIFETEASAVTACNNIDDYEYELDDGQTELWFNVAEVLNDNADHETWLDSVDWKHCPAGGHFDDRRQWALEKAIKDGGTLPVEHPDRNKLCLLQMPKWD